MSSAMARALPNILITGTPATGKSTLAKELQNQWDNAHLFCVGDIVAENTFYESFDESRQSHVLDEEKLLDYLEDEISSHNGGCIVEYHGYVRSDLFPERWFDVVFVLRTSNEALYDRLNGRGYPQSKVTENLECEIFGTLLEEARESYRNDIVHELPSDTPEDMEQNIVKIFEWVQAWKNDNLKIDA